MSHIAIQIGDWTDFAKSALQAGFKAVQSGDAKGALASLAQTAVQQAFGPEQAASPAAAAAQLVTPGPFPTGAAISAMQARPVTVALPPGASAGIAPMAAGVPGAPGCYFVSATGVQHACNQDGFRAAYAEAKLLASRGQKPAFAVVVGGNRISLVRCVVPAGAPMPGAIPSAVPAAGQCPPGSVMSRDAFGRAVCVPQAAGAAGMCPPGSHIGVDAFGRQTCLPGATPRPAAAPQPRRGRGGRPTPTQHRRRREMQGVMLGDMWSDLWTKLTQPPPPASTAQREIRYHGTAPTSGPVVASTAGGRVVTVARPVAAVPRGPAAPSYPGYPGYPYGGYPMAPTPMPQMPMPGMPGQCPPGSVAQTDAFGRFACMPHMPGMGAGQQCPTGSVLTRDAFGNPVCVPSAQVPHPTTLSAEQRRRAARDRARRRGRHRRGRLQGIGNSYTSLVENTLRYMGASGPHIPQQMFKRLPPMPPQLRGFFT
jgi:hypothetical protein